MVLNFKFNVLLNFISVYFVFILVLIYFSVKLKFIPQKYANFLLAVLGHHTSDQVKTALSESQAEAEE